MKRLFIGFLIVVAVAGGIVRHDIEAAKERTVYVDRKIEVKVEATPEPIDVRIYPICPSSTTYRNY